MMKQTLKLGALLLLLVSLLAACSPETASAPPSTLPSLRYVANTGWQASGVLIVEISLDGSGGVLANADERCTQTNQGRVLCSLESKAPTTIRVVSEQPMTACANGHCAKANQQ